MIVKLRLACSFCGRNAAEVGKLVAGRRAYICDRCAEETIRIMQASGDGPFETPPGLVRRILTRLGCAPQTLARAAISRISAFSITRARTPSTVV
jgi:hypothetical protein